MGTLSPQHNWYYAVDQDNQLLCFNLHKKSEGADQSFSYSFEFSMKLHEKDTLAISHHPSQNILATASRDGTVKIWNAV